MRNYLFIVFGVFALVFGHAGGPLVVGYATSHLNEIAGAVEGVLLTPSGQTLNTEPMGPFDHYNIVVDFPEAGIYQAYFRVLQLGSFRLCPIVGGIAAVLCNHPEKSLTFTPRESRIQSFPAGKQIEVGNLSQPICSFEVTQEDLE